MHAANCDSHADSAARLPTVSSVSRIPPGQSRRQLPRTNGDPVGRPATTCSAEARWRPSTLQLIPAQTGAKQSGRTPIDLAHRFRIEGAVAPATESRPDMFGPERKTRVTTRTIAVTKLRMGHLIAPPKRQFRKGATLGTHVPHLATSLCVSCYQLGQPLLQVVPTC